MPPIFNLTFRFSEIAKAKEFADAMNRIVTHDMTPRLNEPANEVSVYVPAGLYTEVAVQAKQLGGQKIP